MERRNGQGRAASNRGGNANAERIRSTTVLCVRRDNKVVMAGDGQVTVGEHVMKHSAKKIRRLFEDKVLAGFAGSTADALSLFARFENKLQEFHGNLSRAAVELAKEWRTDRALRHLDALLVVADTKGTFLLSGHGDIIEPDDGICAIGSGGPLRAFGGARAGEEHKNEREGNCAWKRCASRARFAFTQMRISRSKNCEHDDLSAECQYEAAMKETMMRIKSIRTW